ncbi:MAG: hypothetical protein A3F74_01365 [Betaproteobacteria bacterium RIFCSPLOWO2_12_FULL_62_58]|nr:MAG: hypothetical protein A3F74_01365 [Betaproteobacteria bacterium RIFCSPLOWO2_12_FULL_62_58]
MTTPLFLRAACPAFYITGVCKRNGGPRMRIAHTMRARAGDRGRCKPREALERMLAVRQRHGELGASHLQQDLYDQIMVMAALQLGDLPRVRQLLKARLSTRIWDAATWQAYESRSRRVDEAHDAAAVRAALRWDTN